MPARSLPSCSVCPSEGSPYEGPVPLCQHYLCGGLASMERLHEIEAQHSHTISTIGLIFLENVVPQIVLAQTVLVFLLHLHGDLGYVLGVPPLKIYLVFVCP